ncbi:MAG: LytTR family transcriptional regulator DNA-binding domain-containing protein [Bacteroidota bacterium]
MDLKETKFKEANKHIQIVLFDKKGEVLDSDDSLVKLSGTGFNLFSDTMFCGMEETFDMLELNESMDFDCINTDVNGKTSHYDFTITKLEGNQFSWIIYDCGKQYEKIFELQQERNLAEIQASKVAREASKLKEEKDAIERLYNELLENDTSEYVLVKSDNLLINLDLKDILYFEAYGDYIKVHTLDKMYVTYNTMKNVEGSLPENQFFRIHRSYIVRLDKIKNIEQLSVEINDKTLPIGKSYKSQLIEKMGQL